MCRLQRDNIKDWLLAQALESGNMFYDRVRFLQVCQQWLGSTADLPLVWTYGFAAFCR